MKTEIDLRFSSRTVVTWRDASNGVGEYQECGERTYTFKTDHPDYKRFLEAVTRLLVHGGEATIHPRGQDAVSCHMPFTLQESDNHHAGMNLPSKPPVFKNDAGTPEQGA